MSELWQDNLVTFLGMLVSGVQSVANRDSDRCWYVLLVYQSFKLVSHENIA